MTKRNLASFVVSPGIIERALGIPSGHVIYGAEWDFTDEVIRLFVEGPDLPACDYGQSVPSISPILTESLGEGGARVIIWNWNINTK